MRGAAHLSVLLLTSIIAAGCGGDDDTDTPTAAGTSARTATAKAEPAPLRPPTKAGTKLAYGEPAVVEYAPDDDGGEFRFELTASKPEKGDPSDLEEIVDIGGRIPEGAVPYYVTVHYKLLGDVEPIAKGLSPDDLVFARDRGGNEESSLTIELAEFKPCNQASSLPMQPGVDVESCVVFAPPRGVRLKQVSWRPMLDEGRERVFWGR